MLIFLFWFLFLRDDTSQSEKPLVQTPSINTNTNTQTENTNTSEEDDTISSNYGLQDKDIKELSTFVTNFATKFLSYDKSRPNEHLESVKDMMTPELYNLQKQFNNNSPDIKNVTVKQVSINSYIPGNKVTRANLYVDVTITTVQNTTFTTTYTERYLLSHQSGQWKVVSVGDAETNE